MHEHTPYRVLGYWDNGFRHLSNKVRPIRTPADCKGIRIRTQMSALHGEAFRALGFEPVPADIKDFAAQLAGDRFQAQDNPLTNTYNFGVHKHHRYHTLTGHFFGASVFICNAARYADWPADVRAAVDEAAPEATRYQRQLAAAEDEAMLKKLKTEDVELITPSAAEHAAFVDALAPMLEKYRRELDPALFALLT
jgi:TRAP-type C4-dicarboxylate transport system substrate-binding protein